MCLASSEMNSFFLCICFQTGHAFKKSFPCRIQIRSQAHFQDLCQQHARGEAEGTARSDCCPSWSLGNYLAVLTNASCCLSLTSHQVLKLDPHSSDYHTNRYSYTRCDYNHKFSLYISYIFMINMKP